MGAAEQMADPEEDDLPGARAKRPVAPMRRKLAYAYRGNATEAARLAGYKGDRNTLKQAGWRALQDPGVVAIIEERRRQGEDVGAWPPRSGEAESADDEAELRALQGPELPADDVVAGYQAVIRDTTLPLKDRMRAMERLEQLRERERARSDRSGDQKMADLRARMASLPPLPADVRLRAVAREYTGEVKDQIEALAAELASEGGEQ